MEKEKQEAIQKIKSKIIFMIIISEYKDGQKLVNFFKEEVEQVIIEKDDNAALRRLEMEANVYDLNAHKGNRLECYLVLKEQTSLWLLQTVGISNNLLKKVDLFVTTLEDLMAKTVFVKLPNLSNLFPSLDRQSIGLNSDLVVHLVLIGFSSQAEAIAFNAALVAHYPNYCRDTRLRTRITIINDNVLEIRNRLLQRYKYLFENSYYRTINLADLEPKAVLHRPRYEATRKDFVDIEWEFINGNIGNDAIRRKLSSWSNSPKQQLTIAICHKESERNLEDLFNLPKELFLNKIPILCDTNNEELLHTIGHDANFPEVYCLNKNYCNINVLKILKDLAKRVNYVYNHCYSLSPDDSGLAPSTIDTKQMEEQWKEIKTLPKIYSNIFCAMTLGTKMHSLGHDYSDWKMYYALSIEEIELLSDVEHNRWSVEELLLGYRPITEEEQKMVEKDISKKDELKTKYKGHYDLRASEDLRDDITGKNVNKYDLALIQAIPLIIKTCIID